MYLENHQKPAPTHEQKPPDLGQTININDTNGVQFKILRRSSTLKTHLESQDPGGNEVNGGDSKNEVGNTIYSEERITDCHRDILKLFDGEGWKPLEANVDPKDAVLAVLNNLPDKALLRHSLNQPGEERRTLLHWIQTAKNEELLTKRRDLFRWLMAEHPGLYLEADDRGATVLSSAIQRANTEIPKTCDQKTPIDRQQSNMSFLRFFVREFPKVTSELLKKDSTLVHQLLPMIKGTDSCLKLLGQLDRDTVKCQDAEENTVLHLAVQYKYMCNEDDDSKKRMADIIGILLKKCPDLLKVRNKDKLSLYQHRVKSFYKCTNTKPEDYGEVPLKGDPVSLLLKDRYMRLDDRDEIIKYLHGDSQAYEIHFDLAEISTPDCEVAEDCLKGLVEGLKFEDMLEYVRLPRCKIVRRKHEAPVAPSLNTSLGRGGIGLTAFQLIFNLLREKGVKKIFKVIVEDDGDIPHSDTVIKGLKQFQIEDWDWKKLDLCSEVLHEAAPNAEKITLYSSGNNAILRSWSAVDGLKKFDKLKEVNVHIRQRVESEATINEYADIFVQRMKQTCPQVGVMFAVEDHTGNKESAGQTWFEAAQVSKNVGAWFKNMDKFARFIKNTSQPLGKGVKVAVLDDGIDMLRPDLRCCVKEGISFLAPTNRKMCRAGPFYFSTRGHGTLMASLIRRVCPKAELYIARLNQGNSAEGNLQLTAESAAKAIKWAIQKEVDIISMSWTIANTENNKHDITALAEAIKEAHAKKILMFGAANDQGCNDTAVPYPAKGPGVFCIGAATESGTADGAGESQAHYVFPGGSCWSSIGTTIMQGSRSAEGAMELANGSSFATAIAAGLTALILYCVDITDVKAAHRKQLTDFDTMNSILDSMTVTDRKQRKYIEVKKYFESKFAELDWEVDGKRDLTLAVNKIICCYTNSLTPEEQESIREDQE